MIATVQQPDRATAIQQVLWRALELLNLSGEFLDDSYQVIPELWNRFLQHDSVRLITRFLTERFAQSPPPDSVDRLAQSVAREYGEFLSNACEAVSEKQVLRSIDTQARQSLASKDLPLPNTSTVRIPLEWVPEPERSEVGRYLEYLRSRVRASAQHNLAKYLGETLPLSYEQVVSLSRFLSRSACVAVHDKLNRESALLDWRGRQVDESQVDALWLHQGFLLGSNSGHEHLGFTGYMIHLREQACGKCETCSLVSAIYKFLALARSTFGDYLWTRNELSGYIFCGDPLPDYVGYLKFTTPTYLQAPELGDWRVNGCVSISTLPCLSGRVFSKILSVRGALSPRLFCLATFLILSGDALAWLSSDPNLSIGILSCDNRMGRGKLRSLMEMWNATAPANWRYTSLSNFSRDLKKARLRLGFDKSRLAESV